MGFYLAKRVRVWDDPFRLYFTAPSAPDPASTANAQAQYNQQAAISQAEINDVNQSTPYGSLTYQQTGTAADGTPQYTATTSYTPQMQNLFNTGIQTQTGIANAANSLIGNLGTSLTQAPNINPSSVTKQAMQEEQQYMSPFFTQQQSNLNSQLENQGIMPGSQAYANAQQQMQENQGNVLANTMLSYEPIAFNQAVQQYELPIQTLGTLLGESQPGSVNSSLVSTPQESVSAPNYEQMAEQNYQDQMASYNNMMSGLFSIPSALLGGWAQGAAKASDRRVKRNVSKIGKLENGLPVYAFNYVWSDEPQIGLMADEVENVHPEAVIEFGGLKFVDYARAVI